LFDCSGATAPCATQSKTRFIDSGAPTSDELAIAPAAFAISRLPNHVLNLLAITAQEDARKRFATILPEGAGRISFKPDTATSAGLIERGVFDAVLLIAAGASEHALDEIRALRRMRAEGVILVVVDAAPLAWEETALAAGADFILREPIAGSHIESALRRLVPAHSSGRPVPGNGATSAAVPASASRGSLEILRDFSHILGFSLDHKLFAEHFVAKVREIVGVSRIAVFLEHPRPTVGENGATPRLSCAAAIGVPDDVIECFELSRTNGIGARMMQAPQVLLAGEAGGPAAFDQKVQREFDILGCRVALPISDRARTIGVAVLGAHLTGRLFTQDELQLLYLLMEELGSAIKNTWLHQQLSASHHLLADVLTALSSGCLVVDQNLHVLHANRAMLAFLKDGGNDTARVEFGDLPAKLATPLYDVVVKGEKAAPYFFTGGPGAERLYHVSIIPFQAAAGALPQSAMLVLEDFTQIEAAKRFEIEASKAKLIALIAKRFAHEIRNSLVPLATHEQLLESEYENDDFRRSLKTALARETSRIQRFTEQMLYLAQPARNPGETVNLRDLVETCFHRVSGAAAPAGKLHLRSEAELPLVLCHRPALEHAFQEILTNALQANPDDPVVTVSIEPGHDGGVRVTVRDNGPGFTAEAAHQATEPFFTTRNTGVGLGLTVAEKVVEDHHGQLHVGPRGAKHDFDVEIWLPAAALL
jgi:signal transduction histidine kinase